MLAIDAHVVAAAGEHAEELRAEPEPGAGRADRDAGRLGILALLPDLIGQLSPVVCRPLGSRLAAGVTVR